MTTHNIIKNSNVWYDVWYTAQGVDGWFWWDIWYEYGMWQLASIFGRKYGEYQTLQEALREIGYE